MINLLYETVSVLRKSGHSLKDIVFITDGHNFRKVDDKILRVLLNIDYNNGYGCVEINTELKLVGKDFWLERFEYDGNERWEFKQVPKYKETPSNVIKVEF